MQFKTLKHIKSVAHGFSYVELMTTASIASILIAGLVNVVTTTTKVETDVNSRNQISRDARNALQRITTIVKQSNQLLLPFHDNPNTDWPEHIREETIPASPPIGSSLKSTAVLAVALPESFDLDKDNFPDADDDKDGLIDEDLPDDMSNDNVSGIIGIDDDGDGNIDEDNKKNDDEDSSGNDEDPLNNLDDDNDGLIDEDFDTDNNNDGCSGVCGVDDNTDGNIDDQNKNDNDEDGRNNEDPINPVVFYISNGNLIERLPTPWDNNNDSIQDGKDYIESIIANNVTRFRIERLTAESSYQIVDVTLELSNTETQETISLNTQVRIGSDL